MNDNLYKKTWNNRVIFMILCVTDRSSIICPTVAQILHLQILRWFFSNFAFFSFLENSFYKDLWHSKISIFLCEKFSPGFADFVFLFVFYLTVTTIDIIYTGMF